jgi:TolB-like protein/tRNA A-37 threonylcarbamoyl transferase component Bud32/lipoprotein NlpI
MGSPPESLAAALADRYRIDREVGRGGMATVYLAHDLRHDRKVAIKVLREDLAAALGAERFLREIRLTARLDHPHILALLDSGDAGGTLFYVMPYVEGESLRDRLTRERTIPLSDALLIAREVADALDYAHARSIIHRDIKPENILLAAGHARVADFGIARALSAAEATQVTQVGIVIGTPAYMSPEQAVGETALDGRSDLYSLGCVLYEMITGAAPFAGTASSAILARRFRETPPPLRDTRPEVSGELELLVGRMLSTDPTGRQASAVELARALDAAVTHQSGEGPARTPAGSRPATRSIAVLPFVNMSADPENEYFSDGMTEELISVLTRMGGLQVAARSSVFAYKGKSEDARVIGRALNVDTVLAGSVRKAGNRIRLSAQLTSVADGYQVWADTFDRELSDVFAVQDEISQAIARALQVRLVPSAGPVPGRKGTDDVEAYTLYLRGRFHWGRRTESEIRKGLEHFQQALARDPGYALAEIGVADSYNILGFYDWLHPREAFPRALAAANRALALDDSLAAAYCSRAYVRLYHEWRWAAAEEDFRRALDLAPEYATGWHYYGNLLVQQGRVPEAEAAMQQAVTREPLSLIANAAGGWADYYARRWDSAIAHHRSTIELDPSFMLGHLWLGHALVQAGEPDEATTEYATAIQLSGRSAIAVAGLARACASAGRRRESDRLVAELDELARQRFVPQYDIAAVYAASGDPDAAFPRLSRALEEREHELVFLAVDPVMDPLRTDPRFASIAARVGL